MRSRTGPSSSSKIAQSSFASAQVKHTARRSFVDEALFIPGGSEIVQAPGVYLGIVWVLTTSKNSSCSGHELRQKTLIKEQRIVPVSRVAYM